jgi:hypothetical protein
MKEEQLKYPIGKFQMPGELTADLLHQCILDIALFPERLRNEVQHLREEQLDTAYRPEGWTIRQVVHHCADSHMNSLTRLKLALTEDSPTIKPYLEARWAELPDSMGMPVEPSLKMIEGIHERWVAVLRKVTYDQYKRVFIHPEHGREFRVDQNMALYAWHCNHHLAHITETKKRLNWK